MSDLAMEARPRWEPVREDDDGDDGDGPSVRRFPVPGGWLYQAHGATDMSSPVFVPDPPPGMPPTGMPDLPPGTRPPTNLLSIIENGTLVAKSEEFWRGFVRGLADLRGRLFTRPRMIDGGAVKEVIDELVRAPESWLSDPRGDRTG